MKFIFTTLLLIMLVHTPDLILFDFSSECESNQWRVVDDVVMGGRSDGHFTISEEGHGLYHGNVSLENNGGFSSLRHRFETKDVSDYTKVILRVKGDGSRYQFRIKTSQRDYYSYINYFETNGKWQELELSLKDFYPAFRGRTLNLDNYLTDSENPELKMEEIAFLIGNKKAQSFRLEIDWIGLK